MNLERFHETLDLMTGLNADLKLQTLVEQIRDGLNNIVAAPAQPAHQTSLASALTSFADACAALSEDLTPEDTKLIEELGGSRFFDPMMSAQIKGQISENAMTPSLPRDAVLKFAADRSAYIAILQSTLRGLNELGISGEELPPGSADLAFAIPREIFDNTLGDFAKELSFIDRLMSHLSEAVTGSSEEVKLETLSSTTPTVAIAAGIKVISGLADLVSKFLDAWGKVEKFRAARHQLTELGLSGRALEEISDQITSTIEEVVEESVEVTMSGYIGEPGRRNELRTALTQDTRRLFGQIERGLSLQFRANAEVKARPEDAALLKAISAAGQTLAFPVVRNEPMLLSSGTVLEGEVPGFKYTRKTTTKKTTVATNGKSVTKPGEK